MESSCTTTLQWNYCENKTIWQAWPHLDWEFKLVVHFRHQKVMAESFPHLHDSDNGSIDLVLTVLEYSLCSAGLLLHLRGTAEKHETKWPITFRQQQSHDRCAGSTVSFIWIWLILILKSLCLKSSLQENLSPSSTSLLFGILVRTRAFPQASDCRVRLSSPSSANECVF